MGVLVLRKSVFYACQYQLYPASRVAWIQETLLARYSSCFSNGTFWKAPLLTLKQSGNNFCQLLHFSTVTLRQFGDLVTPVVSFSLGLNKLMLRFESRILFFMLQFFVAAVTIAQWTMIPFYLSFVLYIKSRLKLPKKSHFSRSETHYREWKPCEPTQHWGSVFWTKSLS